jgi:hypothetical protein
MHQRVMIRRTPRKGPEDERGNIIIAIIIIMALATLGTAMAVRVVGNESVVLGRQHIAAGISSADAGLSDALFRIDQGTATGSFCVGTAPTGSACNFVATSIPGSSGVSYKATQVNANTWTLQSVGTVNGQQGAVQETVSRSVLYPFALFGNTGLDFNGNSVSSFTTYTPNPYVSGGSNPNPNPSGQVAVGSNGTISCNGGLGSNVQEQYYSGGGGVSNGCTNTVASPTLQSLPIPTAPNPYSACPGVLSSGNDAFDFGSGFSGAPTVIPAGTYLCTKPVNISGLLDVSGQVSLYIILDPSIYGATTPVVTIVRGAYVNDDYDYCVNSSSPPASCTPTPNLPSAEDLQIFTNSNGTVGNDNGQGYYLGGILDAPDASLTGDGCKSVYYGAAVINTLTCNGGPNLVVNYDNELSSLYGAWTGSGYTQIPPATVNAALKTA